MLIYSSTQQSISRAGPAGRAPQLVPVTEHGYVETGQSRRPTPLCRVHCWALSRLHPSLLPTQLRLVPLKEMKTKRFRGQKYRNTYSLCISYLFLEALGMLFAAQKRPYKFSHLQSNTESLIYNTHLK